MSAFAMSPEGFKQKYGFSMPDKSADNIIGSIHAKSTKACGDQVTDFVQNCTIYSSIFLV